MPIYPLYSTNRSDLHKVIVATVHNILIDLKETSVAHFFIDDLREIHKKHYKPFIADDFHFLDKPQRIQSTLSEIIETIRFRLRELDRAVPKSAIPSSVTVKKQGPNWIDITNEIREFINKQDIEQDVKNFNEKTRNIALSEPDEIAPLQVREVGKIICEVIYSISVVLTDVLAYFLAQYEMKPDPINKVDLVPSWLVEAYEEDEMRSGSELSPTYIHMIANYYINQILPVIFKMLGLLTGYFLYTYLIMLPIEIVKDSIVIFMLSLAIYHKILLEKIEEDGVSKAILDDNRILVNNLLNLLSNFIKIYETCGARIECIEESLVSKMYSDIRNYHYIAISLSAYA